MQTSSSPRGSHARNRRTTALAALVLATATAGGVLTACSSSGGGVSDEAHVSSSAKHDSVRKVLWVGDSIAAAEAPPLRAALATTGVHVKDASSDGGGTVVEGDKLTRPIVRDSRKRLDKDLRSFHPDVVAYQITTYDWGTPEQQRASYLKLARTVRKAGAELVVVSAPPFKLDDFYKGHKDAIRTAPEAAKKAVGEAKGAHFVDAGQLWGRDASAAKAQRSKDGIHSCQQGSAAFADWFGKQLGKLYGFTPASPKKWADGSWVSEKRYAHLDCDH